MIIQLKQGFNHIFQDHSLYQNFQSRQLYFTIISLPFLKSMLKNNNVTLKHVLPNSNKDKIDSTVSIKRVKIPLNFPLGQMPESQLYLPTDTKQQ